MPLSQDINVTSVHSFDRVLVKYLKGTSHNNNASRFRFELGETGSHESNMNYGLDVLQVQ